MTGARAASRVAVATLVACLLALDAPAASAVGTQGAFAITVAPNTAGSWATYNIGRFRTANGESPLTGYTLQFPAGTDASGATSPGAGDIVVVAADNRTVTVTYGTPVPQRTSFYVNLGNVRNPLAAGTHSIASVTFTKANATTETVNLGAAASYVIAAAPYISMTIVTPDSPGLLVDFGNVDPGVTTIAKQVSVQVSSSANYTMTRTLSGDAQLGLAVSGTAAGAKLAGTATYTDDYLLTPPWTTDPDTPLTATVTYTVTQ